MRGSGRVRAGIGRAGNAAARALAARRRWPGVEGGAGPVSVTRALVPAPGRPGASVLVVAPRLDPVILAGLPVVHLLHGFPDAPEQALAAGLGPSVLGAGSLWPPFVLVLPDGTRFARGDHEWADAADGDDLVETWLLDAVVPAVEGLVPRTCPLPPHRRTLAGFSMGGYGALNVGLRRPGVFGALAAFSGYVTPDDPEGVFGGDAGLLAANSPLARASALPAHLLPPRVSLVESHHEPSLVAGDGAALATVLRSRGADVRQVSAPGRHAWRSVAARWPATLTWLASGWSSSP